MELTIYYQSQSGLLAYSGAMMFAILDREAGGVSQIHHPIALIDMLLNAGRMSALAEQARA